MPHKDPEAARKYRRKRYSTIPEVRERQQAANREWRKNNITRSNSTHAIWVREYRKKCPDKFREYDLRKMFRIDLKWYNAQLMKQGGVCAICGHPETERHGQTGKIMHLAVDHNHACCPGPKSCGKCVRGLLCSMCNRCINRAEKVQGWFSHAFDYLQKHPLK